MKLMSAASLCLAAATVMAQEPVWNASAIKDCDRACLVGVLDGYVNAVFKKDPKAVPPLLIDVRMTENAAQFDVGEGVLWRSKTEPTSFKIFVYMKHIRPRRALIVDEQKQTVGTFPRFVHDGTRRGAPPDAPPGMLCSQQIPGDTHRNLQIYPEFSGRTFKHVLVPVWLLKYDFGAKPYQVIVNGYTGAIAGRHPLSVWKIAFLVLVALLVGLIWIWLNSQS